MCTNFNIYTNFKITFLRLGIIVDEAHADVAWTYKDMSKICFCIEEIFNEEIFDILMFMPVSTMLILIVAPLPESHGREDLNFRP